uniref:CCDC144C-like coiled-coil domain-containing protein n=1 Tax=Neogobius melanostomus TaxID=47308 RepID=A0A8C6T416_9GOBI
MEDVYERAQDDLVSFKSELEEEQEEISDDEGRPEEWEENEISEELDSSSLDYRNTMKVQDIFRAYERAVQTLKNKNSHLSDKVKQLEMEKVVEVDHLKHQLKQEQENQRQVTALHNATKDKLQRTEEQHLLQVQEKQQMEVTLSKCELEMQTLVTNMQQLEEEHSETQELLAQERSARALQDELLHKQQEVKKENDKQTQTEFENNRLQNDLQRVTLQLTEKELLVKRLEETVQRLETANSTVEADLKMQYERLKRKALKIREQKNDAESRLHQVETRLNQETNTNSELQKELWSLKHSEQRRLDELQELRRQMDFAQREHSLTEERTRHELQHKLEVNLLLQSKAASQKAQEQINANNAACLRSRLEQRIQELESEVSRSRSTALVSLSQQDAIQKELETYKSMYSEENLLRKALQAKLQRTNTAHPTHRASGRVSGFGPSPSDSGENYRTMMNIELDKAITKELSNSTVTLTSVAALDPVSVASQQYLDQLRRNYTI